MKEVASIVRRISRQLGSGTTGTLAPLLIALWAGFAMVIGERLLLHQHAAIHGLPDPGARHPLTCHDAGLTVGGLNLSIIATANLTGLTIAYLLTRYIPGAEGIAWIGVQVAALGVGFAVAALVGTH